MKRVFRIVFFFTATFLFGGEAFAFPTSGGGGPDGGGDEGTVEPMEAFACNNCSSDFARSIAISEAPRNTCDPYANGTVAQYCPPVKKDILVPAHGSQNIYKFTVTTNVDHNGNTSVSAHPAFTTSTDIMLMNEYFYQYKLLEQAVGQASISSSSLGLAPPQSGIENYSTSSTSDKCSDHPINYFKSDAIQTATKLSLGSDIIDHMGDSSAAEYLNEWNVSGGGFGGSKDGASASVSRQYLQNPLIVTKGDNNFNVLAFDVRIAQNPITGLNQIGLTINRFFTKIDGIQMSDFFSESFDLDSFERHEVSSCVEDFIKEHTELADDQTNGSGGSGTVDDPFIGSDTIGKDSPFQWCRFKTKATTCSSDSQGYRRCTTTIFFSTKQCDAFKVGSGSDGG